MIKTEKGLYCLPIDFASPEFDVALDLRKRVLRDPLGLEFSARDIAKEYDEIHLGCYTAEGQLLGVLSLKAVSADTLKMRQVAVEPARQKQGIGHRLVAASELYGRKKGFRRIELHARDIAVPFYLKQDYQIVGEQFFEVGIAHFAMSKEL